MAGFDPPGPYPVWAGVAVRFSDGSVRAYEFESPEVELTQEIEDERDYFTQFDRYVRPLRQRFECRVVSRGTVTFWNGWRPDGDPSSTAVEPPRRELEA